MIDFLRSVWSFVRPYRVRFFLGLLCGVLYGLTNGILLGVAKVVMDLIFIGATNFHDKLEKAPEWIRPFTHWLASVLPEFHAPVSKFGWVLVCSAIPAVMVLRITLAYLNIYLTNWSAMHAIADIRTKLFAHLQNLSLGFFNRSRTGDLIARITNDTGVLSSIIGGAFVSVIKEPVTIIALVGYQLTIQPKLTFISIVIFPVCLIPAIIFGRKVRKSARAVQEYNAELSNLMHESFTGNRVIKAYNLEDTVISQFKGTTRKYIGHVLRVVRANEIPSQLVEFFAGAGIALVFLYVHFLPKDQMPTQGDFISFILGVVMIYPPIKSVTRLHNQIHQARAASERVFELLATKNSVPEPVAPKMLYAANAEIVFDNIHFAYGGKTRFARHQSYRQARPARCARRCQRLRQNHARQLAPAFLRPHKRRDHHRRRGSSRSHHARFAQPDRRCRPGKHFVQRHHPPEY